jgi:hypothetical protein
MLYQRTATTDRQHAHNNAMQYLVFKRDRPQLYARMLDQLDPKDRELIEAIVAGLEAEQGGQR